MAPFTIHFRHPLFDQCNLMQAASPIPMMKRPEQLPNMPATGEELRVSQSSRMSVFPMLRKVRFYLWAAIRKAVRRCLSATELLSSKLFRFLCAGDRGAMGEVMQKSDFGLGAWERPGWESRVKDLGSPSILGRIWDPEFEALEASVDLELTNPDEGPLMADCMGEMTDREDSFEGEEETALSGWLEWDSEEDEDEMTLPRQALKVPLCERSSSDQNTTSDPSTLTSEGLELEEEDDSAWSEDDEDDSEGSAESDELWQSFLQNGDPYNPLRFSSATETKAKTTDPTQNCPTRPPLTSEGGATSTKVVKEDEEQYRRPHTKEKGKKVRFSDVVTVRPLVVWSFASRVARSGSCWMEMVRDRDRFRRKVEGVSEVISCCLTPQHRATVWEKLQKETVLDSC